MENTEDRVALARKIKQVAIKMLARREHSLKELELKLTKKGYLNIMVMQILEELQQEGLQSDERFAESYVRSKREQGMGPYRIRAELLRRGVSQIVIDKHLAEADTAWFEAAQDVRNKRFGDEMPGVKKECLKQMQFLQYRGFTKDHIRHVFDKVGLEVEHFE